MEFASYAAALSHVHGLPRFKRSNSRDEEKLVLKQLGHPEQQGHFIHVTGTNGKGSTSNAIAHMLLRAGCTVGLYTSPFIMRFNERIQIDNQPVSDEVIRRAAGTVATAIEQLQGDHPGLFLKEFEFVTCMGFVIFAQAPVDVAVIEVGIGGTHDSTNVITPDVAVISNVAMDHMAQLGNTLTAIATEKSGIIKPGVPAVTGKLPAEAATVVAARVQECGSPLYRFGEEFSAKGHADAKLFGEKFTYQDEGGKLTSLEFPLLGSYQVQNAAVAIKAAKLYAAKQDLPLTAADIRHGLAASHWPVRMERVSSEPLIVLDGAHNPDGVSHALASIRNFDYEHVTLIVGILADKAMDKMLKSIAATGAEVFLVQVPDNPRAATEADYRAAGADPQWRFCDWHDALADSIREHPQGLTLILGSLYLASAVRQELFAAE
ncbi:bifunctional folylpolyglutamate synthase/dihydrofolate synthase [Lacticaseibacillus zhaodongensis]|uniref:bifunctional folylpolyglutamate synthase/dihydrofolate synthase n=1 Tax=Lacticaseibacillus zhaodongensis TaxID=2668065 RepID=UPI001E57F0BC|nr:folylpolyglutamate synthase/dihydrofolate synthase family protein [Lacticaseibacillus zhaodongensis]